MINRRMFRHLWVTVIMLAVLSGLTGCGFQYNLAVSVEGSGEVSPSPGIHSYKRGSVASLAVTPADGWYFAGWGGPDADWVSDSHTILMEGHRYITAIFAQLQHPLGVVVEPEEAGQVDVVIVPQTRAIQHGQVVRLTAVPEPGYAFGYWDDDPTDRDNPKMLTMDAPRTVKAVFTARVANPHFSLEAGAYTGGQNVQISCGTPDATIRYTTDGITMPSATVGTVLESPGTISVDRPMTIRAVAYKDGLPDSAVVSKAYTIKFPAPEISLTDGTYGDTQMVTMTCPDASIRYTLDGSTPTSQSGLLYTGPIQLPGGTTTLKAVAYGPVLAPSDVVTRVYTINRWPQRAPMPTARRGLAAVTLNGKVYTIGGHDGTSYVTTMEMYDPATNTWETKAPMPTARGCLGAVVLGGRIYAIGGQIGSGDQATAVVEIYDPASNTWSEGTVMPEAVGLITAIESNGRIVVLGGGCKTRDMWLYNPSLSIFDRHTHTWTNQSLNFGLFAYSAVLLNGEIYYLGGRPYMTPKRLYEVAGNTWNDGTNVPAPSGREDAAAVVINGLIYFFGGAVFDQGQDYSMLDTVSVLNPASNIWTTIENMPFARRYHAAAVVDGRVFVFGGDNGNGVPLSDVREFLP